MSSCLSAVRKTAWGSQESWVSLWMPGKAAQSCVRENITNVDKSLGKFTNATDMHAHLHALIIIHMQPNYTHSHVDSQMSKNREELLPCKHSSPCALLLLLNTKSQVVTA